MAALLVANTLLWPMARFLNDKFVPEQHRVTANHIITVCDRLHVKAYVQIATAVQIVDAVVSAV